MMIQSRMKFMLSDNCPTVVPNGSRDESDPLRLMDVILSQRRRRKKQQDLPFLSVFLSRHLQRKKISHFSPLILIDW